MSRQGTVLLPANVKMEAFVLAWQKSGSVQDVCATLGVSYAAHGKDFGQLAGYLRKRGVRLKLMRRSASQWAELARVADENAPAEE